jgi:flagellar hook-associated protein 3 FlgL
MRIATSRAYEASIANLQERQQNLSKSQQQLTSGKRVVLASDDPTNAARAERALAQIARADANQRTLDASRNVMNLATSSLTNATDLLQTARESMVAAGNASYSAADRKSLAIKLKDIRDQLLTVANRPDGGGGYVFGGQGSSSPPFVDTANGVVFQGQTGEQLASTGERLNLTLDGQKIWLAGKSGNGVFNTAPSASANSGGAWITSGAVTSPSDLPYPSSSATPPAYSVVFHNSGGAITYDVLEDGNALASGQTYGSGKSIAIPGKGMSVSVSGTPAEGDTFDLTQSNHDFNIFTSLDQAIAGLTSPTATAASVAQAVNTGLTSMDAALSSVQGAQSEVGEQLNRMDGIESRNSDQKLAAQNEKSNAEDLDMVAALSDFKNQDTGYAAALQSYAMVQKLSLFNYINS